MCNMACQEAPRVDPKYYTQTVAITSKPWNPTFHIPYSSGSPAKLGTTWRAIVRGRGGHVSASLAVCPSVSSSLSRSPHHHHRHPTQKYLSVSFSPVCGSLSALSVFPFLPLPVRLHLAYLFLLSSTALLSPTHPLTFFFPYPAVLHLFVCFFVYLAQLPVSHWCRLSAALLLSTRLLLCLLVFRPSVSLSLCVSRYSCRDFPHMLDIDLRPQPDPLGH